MRITISGPPGSGTTTAAYLLSEKTGLPVFSAGEEFRKMAKERGVSLAEFTREAEMDPSIDKDLDRRMVEIARKEENAILEGRLVGVLTHREGIDAFRVYLTAPVEVRASRIARREGKRGGGDKEKVYREMVERENSEKKRYKEFYNIDVEDMRVYDIVIDTEKNPPEKVVDLILAGIREKKKWTPDLTVTERNATDSGHQLGG